MPEPYQGLTPDQTSAMAAARSSQVEALPSSDLVDDTPTPQSDSEQMAAFAAIEAEHGISQQADSLESVEDFVRSVAGEGPMEDAGLEFTHQEGAEGEPQGQPVPQAPEEPEVGDLAWAQAMVQLNEAGLSGQLEGLSKSRVVDMAGALKAQATAGTAPPPEETRGHSEHVRRTAEVLGEAQGLDEDAQNAVADALSGLERSITEGQDELMRGLIEDQMIHTVQGSYPAHQIEASDDNRRELTTDALTLWEAGKKTGKYAQNTQGMRRAFGDAARQLYGAPPQSRNGNHHRPATVTPSTRTPRRDDSKITWDQYEALALQAADMAANGNKAPSQRLKERLLAGQVEPRKDRRF